MSRLYPCAYCTEDGYCEKYCDEEVNSWCVQGPCKDERPSNADRIRAMTDEELAEQLYLLRLDALRLEGYEGFIETKDEVLDWLKSVHRLAEEVDEQPTIDAVPVVRCRDCKYSHPWYADRRTCELWTETGVDVFNGRIFI